MSETSKSDAARALGLSQPKEIKDCIVCGREFEGVLRARCCSQRCASLDYWRRHREELNRKRREKYQRGKGVEK